MLQTKLPYLLNKSSYEAMQPLILNLLKRSLKCKVTRYYGFIRLRDRVAQKKQNFVKVALNRKYSVTQMCDENPKICLVANFYSDIWNQHEKTYQKLHRFEEKCKKLDFLGSLTLRWLKTIHLFLLHSLKNVLKQR